MLAALAALLIGAPIAPAGFSTPRRVQGFGDGEDTGSTTVR